MHKKILLLFCLLSVLSLSAQERKLSPTDKVPEEDAPPGTFGESRRDFNTNSSRDRIRPPIVDYKIVNIKGDTTVVDTSLTVEKMYKWNYLRKDRFNLLPFMNTGQTHNTLLYNFDENSIKPLFGARARHFNYMEAEDFKYYEVPTPLTDLYYKSVYEQGQTLDAFLTMNISRRFNFSIAYKGLRSLGKYQNHLTSTGNFRFGFNYRTKNERYAVKAHYVAQDLLNRENGGLTEQGIENFRSAIDEFEDRSRLEVNFQNAENILDGQRFYIDHYYAIINPSDTLTRARLQLGHVLNFRDKFYEYRQVAPFAGFGPSFVSSNIKDRVDLEDFENQVYLRYTTPALGTVTFNTGHSYYDYGYNSVLIGEDERIPNRLQGNLVFVGGQIKKKIRGLDLDAAIKANVAGDFNGFDFNASGSYRFNEDFRFKAAVSTNSRLPNYNHLLYQSSYENYNWYNLDDYKNIRTGVLAIELESDRWVNASLDLTTIRNFAYFATDEEGNVRSFQTDENIGYLTLKINKELKWGRFALNNTVAYQNVSSGKDFLKVPELVTRNTLYYTDRWFKNALFIQTGINFKYFTNYYMNAYDPVLAEFYVQENEKLGAFPLIDVFFNMKVRQTRIFVIAEHVNSPFTGNDFFSAPGYPYRDFNIRFGLVWNLFL